MAIQKFILKYNAEEETLVDNPDGWSENGQMWQRHKEYHGVFQSYTVNTFRFGRKSGQGGDFIYEKYLIDDIKTIIAIEIYDRNPQTDDFDISYIGLLNFDPEKFRIERDFVEIGFVQNSDIQKFTTNDEIELNIKSLFGLDGTAINDFVNAPAEITFKGINLFLIVEETGYFSRWLFFNNNPAYEEYPIEDREIYYYGNNVEINEIGDRLQTIYGETGEDHYIYEDSDRTAEIYTNDTDFDTEIIFTNVDSEDNGSRVFFAIGAGGYAKLIITIVLQIYDSEDVLTGQDIIWSETFEETISGDFTHYINYNISDLIDTPKAFGFNWSVPAGGRMVLRTMVMPEASTWINSFCSYQQQLTNNLSFVEKSPTIGDTINNGYLTHELFTRVFQQILSKENGFYSEFFGRTDSEFISYMANGPGSLDFIIDGWNLRQFPNSQFVVEFKKLFQTFDGIYNLMIGYDKTNERFYIEQKSEAFKSDLIMFDVGEVSECVITPYKDAYFNEIEAGYEEKGDYEEVQGIYEINLNQNYAVNMPVKETLKIKAPYNTDSIGMELARRKPYSAYASEDTKYDEKIYVVRTDGSETIQGGEDLSGFTGIEERYNLCFTPRENTIRWASFIKSGLWKEGTITLKFQSATKSINITYKNQNGDIVDEFDNITDSDLPDLRLFDPQYYEFEGVFNLSFKEKLDENPHGLIKFDFNGIHYAGFIDELQTQDYNRKAKYKLIAYATIEGENKLFMDDDPALFMDDDEHTLL